MKTRKTKFILIGIFWILPCLLASELIYRVYTNRKYKVNTDTYNQFAFRQFDYSSIFPDSTSPISGLKLKTSVGNFSVSKDRFRGGQYDLLKSKACSESSVNENVLDCTILSLDSKKLRTRVNPNEIHILFLGGSTTFGIGSTDNGTFPKLLTQKIKSKLRDRIKITSMNMGVGGYSSHEQLKLAELIVSQSSSPDITISLDGVNDARCNYLEKYVEKENENISFTSLISRRKRFREQPKGLISKSKVLSAIEFRLRRLIEKKENIDYDKNKYIKIRNKKSRACAILYVGYLDSLAHLIKSNNASNNKPVLISVLQPHRNFLTPDLESPFLKDKINFLSSFYNEVKLLAAKKKFDIDVHIIDVYKNEFRESLWIDDDHLNDAGNMQLSDIVLDEMEKKSNINKILVLKE